MHEFLPFCRRVPAETTAIPSLPTLDACLHAIDAWLRVNAPKVHLAPAQRAPSLPEPFCASSGSADILALFARHDGSNEERVVPMADDISYDLMSLADSLAAREMMCDLFAQERHLPDVPPDFWQTTWLPIAANGAGDYLVWEATGGKVMRFSHESRLVSHRAMSLLELFQDIASGLQSGKYGYSEARGIA